MKHFDEYLQEQIADYEGRHDDLIFQAPGLYRLMTNLLDDPSLPERLRPLVLAAIAYFILPADIISEELEGPYGYVDDIYLCAFVAERVRQAVGSEVILTGNWDGEAPVVELIGDILGDEALLDEKQRALMMKYIGYEYLGG